MRRLIAMLTALAVLMTCSLCLAESYVMAGYDTEDSGHDWQTNLFFKRMEERTGISFTFRQYTDEEQWTAAKAEMTQAGAELPDVLFKASLTADETQSLYDSGVLIDLKPYLEEYAPNLWALLQEHSDWLDAITLQDGSIVALPLLNELQNNNAMWINKTWLDNLGLEIPTTAEELTEVLRAFKTKDPNQNGKADEIPLQFLSMWDLKFLGHAFGMVTNDFNVYLDEDGQIKTNLDTQENREFLTWLHQLWEEELIDHSGFTTTDSLRTVTDSSATITYGMFLAPTPISLLPSTAISDYVMLDPLVYNGTQTYRKLFSEVVTGTFAITSACSDPAALLSWADYLYTEDGCFLSQNGLEGVEWTRSEDGTWDWVDDTTTVENTIMPTATISDGASCPGYVSASYQMDYDNADTHRVIVQLDRLRGMSRLAVPQVTLTGEDTSRLTELQNKTGAWAEQQMVHFVTGDTELNDETWSSFCSGIHEQGIDDIIALWQEIIDR